jgi:hypothetical protein
MPGMIGHNQKSPHAFDHGHSRTGIHPITTLHNNSPTGTSIIVMITLTPDKFILVKADISIRDSV